MTSLKFCLYLAERWLQNIPSQVNCGYLAIISSQGPERRRKPTVVYDGWLRLLIKQGGLWSLKMECHPPLRFLCKPFSPFGIFLKDETREKAQALLKKLYLQFRRSGTEAVLIAHKLNVPEYLRVVGKPAHLIVSLYEHPSISGRLRNTSGKDYPGGNKTSFFGPGRAAVLTPSCRMLESWVFTFVLFFFFLIILDIHEAAKEIAEVNEINLEKIWDMLLEKWLCPSTVPSEVSECYM